MKILPLILALPLLYMGCEPDVISDYDPNAPFKTYKTFRMCPEDITSVDQRFPFFDSETNRQFVYNVITEQMQMRGYTLNTESPDIIVSFNVALEDKQELVNRCTNDKENQYWTECKLVPLNYTHGTLVLQFTDNGTGAIVWESAVSDMLMDDQQSDSYKDTMERAIQLLMEQYPFQMGSGISGA